MSVESPIWQEDEVHNLANEEVNQIEKSFLSFLEAQMRFVLRGSENFKKIQSVYSDEIYRIYGEDEDHEIIRDLNDKYERWLKGDDIKDE